MSESISKDVEPVPEIGSIEARLRARSRRFNLDADDMVAANRLLSLLVDCLIVQRDNGINPNAELCSYDALSEFLRVPR